MFSKIRGLIAPNERIIIMGGNKILNSDGNNSEEILGIFSDETKAAALDLFDKIDSTTDISLVSVTNDWGLLKGDEGEEVRMSYWSTRSEPFFDVPKENQYLGFGTHGNTDLPGEISEKRLQNMFRNLSRSYGDGSLEKLVTLHTYEHCVFDQEEGDIRCDNAKCAIEVLMLFKVLSEEFDHFIGFMPNYCIFPIEGAVSAFNNEEVREKIKVNVSNFRITRIYCNSNHPTNTDELYDKTEVYSDLVI